MYKAMPPATAPQPQPQAGTSALGAACSSAEAAPAAPQPEPQAGPKYRRARSHSKKRVPLAHAQKSCGEVEEAQPATNATAHGAPKGVLKAHVRTLAAIVGLNPKGDDGEFNVSQLEWATLPFVWLVALRKEACRKNGVPEDTVLLRLLPEAESKCEFPILRLSSPLSVVIRNSQCHHHHSCFRLRSSLSFVIRNILPLAHGST